MKKLTVDIIGTDCSANGPTKEQIEGILWLETPRVEDLEIGQVNFIILETTGFGPGRRNIEKESGAVKRVRAVAVECRGAELVSVGQMFSGQWITTSDSRFPFDCPVPCHTRVESQF